MITPVVARISEITLARVIFSCSNSQAKITINVGVEAVMTDPA